MRPSISGAMPMRVWATVTENSPSSVKGADTVTVPPAGVNFTALEIRFWNTWRMRTPSVTTVGRVPSVLTSIPSLRGIRSTTSARSRAILIVKTFVLPLPGPPVT